MENNLSDALKMSAAIMIFVLALSAAMMAFSRVKKGSDQVFKIHESLKTYYNTDKILLNGNEYDVETTRIVGVENIIPTMYSYYDEGITILFYSANYSNGVLSNIKPIPLYYTDALDVKLKKAKLAIKIGSGETATNTRFIYGLDLLDEQIREEPWRGTKQTAMNFIRDIVNGYTKDNHYQVMQHYHISRPLIGSQNQYINQSESLTKYVVNALYTNPPYLGEQGKIDKPLINSKGRFIERVGQYNSKANFEIIQNENNGYSDYTGSTEDKTIKSTSDSETVDEFSNGETLENTTNEVKKVIQYIYIGES